MGLAHGRGVIMNTRRGLLRLVGALAIGLAAVLQPAVVGAEEAEKSNPPAPSSGTDADQDRVLKDSNQPALLIPAVQKIRDATIRK